MAQISRDVLWSSLFGQYVPVPQHEKLDGTMVPTGANNPLPVQLSGSIVDVTLQNAVTAAGNGTAHAPTADAKLRFEITGTSTSRTVNFEIAGISGVYVPVTAFNINDPTKFGTSTTAGSDAAPDSWEVEIPVGWSFRARVSAVAGGNVSVKGKSKAVI